MDVIGVIPIGTKVSIKNSEAEGTIESITLDGTTTSYHIVSYDNMYGKRGYWVKESEISGKFKKTTILQSMIRDSKEEPIVESKHLKGLTLSTNTVKSILEYGFYIPIADKPVNLEVNKLPRVEVVDIISYADTGNILLVPGDKVFKVYVSLEGTSAEYEPIMTLFRVYRLKPFYKRWYNTLKYGREHIGNFDYIESTEDYFTRVVTELVKSCPNGFMCNKNTVVL